LTQVSGVTLKSLSATDGATLGVTVLVVRLTRQCTTVMTGCQLSLRHRISSFLEAGVVPTGSATAAVSTTPTGVTAAG
jgi:hypothetical protein